MSSEEAADQIGDAPDTPMDGIDEACSWLASSSQPPPKMSVLGKRIRSVTKLPDKCGCGKTREEFREGWSRHVERCSIPLEQRQVACPKCAKLISREKLGHHQQLCSISLEQRLVQCTEDGCCARVASLQKHLARSHGPCQQCDGCSKPYHGFGHENPSLTPGMKLCALCSRSQYAAAGVQWPGSSCGYYCTACTEEGMPTEYANYDGQDEDGALRPHKLCARHAKAAGTKSSYKAGASHAACDAVHAVAAALQLEVVHHVHFEPGEEPIGYEISVLAGHRNIKVDAVLKDGDGMLYAFQFHGDYYHGYQMGHTLHDTFVVGHQWGPDKIVQTLRRTEQASATLPPPTLVASALTARSPYCTSPALLCFAPPTLTSAALSMS